VEDCATDASISESLLDDPRVAVQQRQQHPSRTPRRPAALFPVPVRDRDRGRPGAGGPDPGEAAARVPGSVAWQFAAFAYLPILR
jgi:hypothetical protein